MARLGEQQRIGRQGRLARKQQNITAARESIGSTRAIDYLGGELKSATAGFIKNVPKSALGFGKGIYETIRHPVGTIKGLTGLGLGLAEKLIPGEQSHEIYANAVEKYYKERYGSFDNLMETIYNDPVGYMSDLSVLYGGVGGAAKGVGTITKSTRLMGVGQDLLRAGTIVNPLTWPKQVGKASISLATKMAEKRLLSRSESLYQSSLKPTTALLKKEPGVVKTGLKEQIPVSERGLETARGKLDLIKSEIDDLVVTKGKGQNVPLQKVANRIDDAKAFYKDTVLGQKQIKYLDEMKKAFLSEWKQGISVPKAQTIKKNTYRVLRNAYGELKSVEKEGMKALNRGLKEEIAIAIPEVGQLNARAKPIIGLIKALDRFSNRSKNRALIGLTPAIAGAGGVVAKGPTAGGLAMLLTKVADNPTIKSKIAIIMYNAATGKLKPVSPPNRWIDSLRIISTFKKGLGDQD